MKRKSYTEWTQSRIFCALVLFCLFLVPGFVYVSVTSSNITQERLELILRSTVVNSNNPEEAKELESGLPHDDLTSNFFNAFAIFLMLGVAIALLSLAYVKYILHHNW